MADKNKYKVQHMNNANLSPSKHDVMNIQESNLTNQQQKSQGGQSPAPKKKATKVKINQAIDKQNETENIDFMNIKKLKEMTFAKKKNQKMKQFSQSQEVKSPAADIRELKNESPQLNMISFNRNDSNDNQSNKTIEEEQTMEEEEIVTQQKQDKTPVSIMLNNLMLDAKNARAKQNNDNIMKFTNQKIGVDPCNKNMDQVSEGGLSAKASSVSRGQKARKSWLAQEKADKIKKQQESNQMMIKQQTKSNPVSIQDQDGKKEAQKSVKIELDDSLLSKRPESSIKFFRKINSQVGLDSTKLERFPEKELDEEDKERAALKRRKKQQFINLDDPDDIDQGISIRFSEFKQNFLDMTERQKIYTQYDVVSIILTHDSTMAISVLYAADNVYLIRLYKLETDQVFEYKLSGKHLKCYEVQQNPEGTIYGIPFLDAGIFRLIIFNSEKILSDIHINEMLEIDSSTIAINGVHDPIINVCFLDSNVCFVNLFHKVTKQNYHFKYSIKNQEMIDKPVITLMNCTSLNFPIQNFYDNINENIYCFYRHGQCLTVDANKIKSVQYESIVDQSLGKIYFVYNKYLVANSSNKVLFFRRISIRDDYNNVSHEWEEYDQIENGGFIYYTKGNTEIQITTEKLIYFYSIDEDSGTPKLENCIYNYMNCSHLMFGSESRYCITYKTGQTDFWIFKRKYFHKFIVKINHGNFDHSVGLAMNNENLFAVSTGNYIKLFNQKDYSQISEFEVPFPQRIRREKDDYDKKQVVLNMKISQNLQFMAIIVGHELPMDESENSFLFIFQHQQNNWNLVRQKDMDAEDLIYCSRQIEFNRKNQNEIFLTNCKQVLVYNFYNDDLQQTYVFQNYLNSQPIYTVFNKNQNCAIIGSFYDVLFINIRDDIEIDIDELFHISDIRSVINLNQKFYVLANKCDNLLGYHLIEIDENYPDTKDPKFLINWKSKLDIGDANLYLVRGQNDKDYLIVSYKSIHVNSYTVLMVNLDSKKIEYRLESYHLWENKIQSFILKNNDQVILTQDGMCIVSHGLKPKKVVTDENEIQWMLRALPSCSDLKLEMSNHMLFQHKKQDMIVSIQEQYQDESEQTYFENIYQLDIKDMTLRDLMLCQSIFTCRQQYDVPILVKKQNNPSVFFNSYLELEKTNLLSILSFDSKSIQHLLSEQKNYEFSSQYPLFYQTRYFEFDEELTNNNLENCQKKSGIDIAFDNLQIRALNTMIEYVITYQNSYVYSFLFQKNFMQLVQVGINVEKLLNSEIFCYQFDYMEWPSIHGSNHVCIRPYNNSIFNLRQSYKKIFQDFELQWQSQQDALKIKHKIRRKFTEESKKIYKIKYTLNVLPGMSEEMGTLMDTIGMTEELNIFECKSLITYIEFKWTSYAAAIHQIGATFHLWYFVSLTWFINEWYVYRTLQNRIVILSMMAVSLLYPTIYDFTQLKKQGMKEYLSEFWNYFDQAHIWLGYINIILQWMFQDKLKDASNFTKNEQQLHDQGVQIIEYNTDLKHLRKVITIFVTFVMLLKTFFYLRIFKGLSYLVLMMNCVVKDLTPFMIFYFLLLWMTGLVFQIIEVGNIEHASSAYLDADNFKMKNLYSAMKYSGVEYHYVPVFLRQLLTCFRMSLGDFDFGESIELSAFNSHLFFYNLIFTLTCTMIIFLNFIIAEVSSSYAKITEKISGLNEKERSLLIEEAEDMMLSSQLDDKMLFPKYLIMREIES